ncbi:hypothetical protein B296_00015221 [Ensete ventricosum]|uniref:Uncharacterized protein n=1 Tax=Ensete ventricosum TaxID=4639 RepID=A0A426Z4X4_ENSVE|nr:hypothetical protein B296_00015221 [Ensete ventricosum]
MGNVPPIFHEESELVGKLRGILPYSRAIKDMIEAWLIEVGLSSEPRGIPRAGEGQGYAPEKVKSKGKELIKEVVEPAKTLEGPRRLPTMKKLCAMGGRVGDDKYLAAQVPDLLGPQARAPLKVLELKLGVGPDAMATVKKWAVDLKVEVKRLRAEVEHLKAALEDTKQHCQALEREAKKSQGEAKNLRST